MNTVMMRNDEMATIQDCIGLYVRKGMAVLLNDGKVVGFVKEKRVPDTVHATNNITRK